MKCPRCPDSTLEEREREGVTVDACRSCYGIWLDRGELERLIARAREEIERLEARSSQPAEERREPRYEPRGDSRYDPRDERRRERWDDDDRHRRHDGRHGHERKRWFDALGDIFD